MNEHVRTSSLSRPGAAADARKDLHALGIASDPILAAVAVGTLLLLLAWVVTGSEAFAVAALAIGAVGIRFRLGPLVFARSVGRALPPGAAAVHRRAHEQQVGDWRRDRGERRDGDLVQHRTRRKRGEQQH
jgi:hypothetical protein